MNDLALRHELETAQDRFNALAQVAGREIPARLKRAYTVPLTVLVAGIGAASEAKFGVKGAIANGAVAVAAYITGMLAGDNADMREGAYTIAAGLGSAATSIMTYDKVTTMMAAKVAPPPVAQPQAA